MTTPDLRSIGFTEVRARLAGNRLAVYDALHGRGPSTGSELAASIGWPVTSVRPRLTELRDMFHVIETGERRDSEHVFRTCTAREAEALHEAARKLYGGEVTAPERSRLSEAGATLAAARNRKPVVVEQPEFSYATVTD